MNKYDSPESIEMAKQFVAVVKAYKSASGLSWEESVELILPGMLDSVKKKKPLTWYQRLLVRAKRVARITR